MHKPIEALNKRGIELRSAIISTLAIVIVLGNVASAVAQVA